MSRSIVADRASQGNWGRLLNPRATHAASTPAASPSAAPVNAPRAARMIIALSLRAPREGTHFAVRTRRTCRIGSSRKTGMGRRQKLRATRLIVGAPPLSFRAKRAVAVHRRHACRVRCFPQAGAKRWQKRANARRHLRPSPRHFGRIRVSAASPVADVCCGDTRDAYGLRIFRIGWGPAVCEAQFPITASVLRVVRR